MSSLLKTMMLKVDPGSPDRDIIRFCAKAVREGALVAFPTETVYGLAANLSDGHAMERLSKIKERPEGKAYTVHISDKRIIEDMGCSITEEAKALISKYWPGPLTIVLASGKGPNVGFRMPANIVALRLIGASGVPVAAPSANISGRTPPKTAAEVMDGLNGKIDIVLDGGPTEIGIESTVVDMSVRPFRVLREGAIRRYDLEMAIR